MESEFPAIFQSLRALYAKHETACVILHDDIARYYLGTHHVRSRDGYRLWFGGVEIKKSYVSAHVIPVYVNPGLLDGISSALRRRMQGKACFNFRVTDEALFAELGALIDTGAALFVQRGALLLPAT